MSERLSEERLEEIERGWECHDPICDDGVCATIKSLTTEIRALQREVAEQCRLNGMGQERELKLMAELKQMKRDRDWAEQRTLTLQRERDDLKYVLTEINKHVMPGEMDSAESLRAIIRERDALRERLDRLRKAATKVCEHDEVDVVTPKFGYFIDQLVEALAADDASEESE